MSLVNDMLRDLDARQPQPSHNSDHLPSGLSRRPSRGAWRLVLLGFFAVSLLAVLGYWYLSAKSLLAERAPEKTVLAAQPEPALDMSLVATPSLGREEHAATARTAPSSVASGQLTELSQSLRLAQAALVAGQLTTPIDASAYWYYQKALQLDPDNREARAGIEQIAARYLERARRAQNRGDYARALELLDRALAVSPDNATAQALLGELQVEGAASAPVVANNAPAKPAKSLAPPVRPASENNPVHDSVAAESTDTEMAGQDTGVSTSWATRDRQTQRDAERLVSRSQPGRAQQLLSAFIAEASTESFSAPQSRRYLQSLLLRASEFTAAENLIVPTLSARDKHYLQARLYEHRGELTKALQILEQGYASAESDEAYRALTASLYQNTGNYSAAESHYRRLLEVFGPRARYWLGLALALDQQQRYQPASVAYRRAREASDATAVIVKFADQRLIQIAM
ncbi:tetratricopeptide repeat protein [Gilvimarinus japonicus]|uniref:Tetratricopeptide repeat protein n=1 Tax=Gilvimarinus japonicus TaxID=1796469 RepID=A0ABV7HIA6_9GAMM